MSISLTGLYQVTGSVETTVTNTLGSALDPISGSINSRRLKERKKYDRVISDIATRAEVGESSISGSEASYSQQLATSPSWTQSKIGKKHAYVSHALSSSLHEVSQLNTFNSGSEKLENTVVAASASMFYEKTSRLITRTYKLSASAYLPRDSEIGYQPSLVEQASSFHGPSGYNVRGGTNFDLNSRLTWHDQSGSYVNASAYAPAEFVIDVPDYGLIRDIKVWVEFVHDLRGGHAAHGPADGPFATGGIGIIAGSASYQQVVKAHGLGGIEIALKSPNVSFDFAHPLWNDKTTRRFQSYPISSSGIPRTLEGTYLLWSGHRNRADFGYVFPDLTGSSPDNEWTDETMQSDMEIHACDRDDVDNIWAVFTSGSAYATASIAYSGSFFGNVSRGWRYNTLSEYHSAGTAAPDMCVDRKTSTPHVTYSEISGSSFRIMHVTSGNLTGLRRTQIWTSDVYTPYGCHVVLNPATSNPHFVFSTSQTSGLSYYHLVSSSTGISQEIIPGTQDVVWLGRGKQIAFDQSGTLSFLGITEKPYAAANAERQVILFRSSSISGWSSEIVPTTQFVGATSAQTPYPTTIKFDKNNNLHIFMSDPGAVTGGTRSVYGISSSLGWNLKFLDMNSVGSEYGTQAMDLDNQGFPHFITNNTPAVNLDVSSVVYARSGTLGLSANSIYTTGSLNASHGLVIDSKDRPHIFVLQSSVTQHYLTKHLVASSSNYYEYDRDIDMRTVFCDSSNVENPRSLMNFYSNPQKNSPGSSGFWTKRVLDSKYPSPTSASIALYTTSSIDLARQFGGFTNDSVGFLTGCNFPWFYDSRIPAGAFVSHVMTMTPGGSPPAGWLTGAGGVANVNEFATTGSNIGPENIKPVYPLLDDVYVEKIYDAQTSSLGIAGTVQVPEQRSRLIGFRPGLRGTEVHGKWKLLVACPSFIDSYSLSAQAPTTGSDTGIWFRQFRLEFVLEQRRPATSFIPSSRRRHARKTHAEKPGLKLVDIVSGSSTWDIGVNYVYVNNDQEHGQTVGIISSTGSLSNEFAVFSRLTGSLADANPHSDEWYLKNEFGTPFIPISSGTAFPSKFDPFTPEDSINSRRVLDQIMNPQASIFADNTLNGLISRSETVKTTRTRVLEKVQESQMVVPSVVVISGTFNL